MPLPLTVSCSSKSRLVLTFLVLPLWYLLTRVVPDIFQKGSKTVVCVCTPGEGVVGEVVWFGDEDDEYDSVVKVQSFDEHPGEHDRLGELHTTDQQLTDHHLQQINRRSRLGPVTCTASVTSVTRMKPIHTGWDHFETESVEILLTYNSCRTVYVTNLKVSHGRRRRGEGSSCSPNSGESICRANIM